jgi:hypothetical protein
MSYRRRQLVNGGSASFDPSSVLTAWLENGVSVGAVSSVADRMNTNPATQGTAVRQPTGAATGTLTWDGNDCLSWPLVASQNKATGALAFAFWFKPASILTNQGVINIHNGTGGASIQTLRIYTGAGTIVFEVRNNGLVGRRGVVSAVVSAGVSAFITGEFNGAMASEATRHVVTLGGVVQTLTFSALSGGLSDTVLNDPTGNLLIGGAANADIGNEPIAVGGITGRDVFVRAGSAMSGATEGVWTSATRLKLMNYRPLV